MFSHQANPQLAEFVLVEYPGVVRNLDRALGTLGGLRAISSAHFHNLPLELHFRPDNPFDSSLVAERRNQTVVFSGQLNLVIRVRRRRRTEAGSSRGEQAEGGEGELDIKCLGMVSTIYSFRAISDFQYLPLSNAVREHRGVSAHHDLVPDIVPPDFHSALSWWDEEQHAARMLSPERHAQGLSSSSASSSEFDLFLPPYQFSRYNFPSKFLLRDEVDMKRPPVSGHAKSLRTERKALTTCAQAKDPFPATPSDEALQDVELRCKNPAHHRMFVELFNERPLWPRLAISYRTRMNNNMLKIILAKYAFYILSGPWGRLWCRFGYDPRLDPEARKYQSIMVTFKRNQYIPERPRLKAIPTSSSSLGDNFHDYVYRQKQLPPLRQMWYCVCDIGLPLAKVVCRPDWPETLRVCDPAGSGWLPPGRIEAIRQAIKADVAQMSQRIGQLEEGEEPSPEELEDDFDAEEEMMEDDEPFISGGDDPIE